MENCKICNSESKKIFQEKVLNKYKISYFQCSECGFTQTETPYWLDESYIDSMSLGDVGQMLRTLNNIFKTRNLFNYLFNKKGQFLDFGGGYGLYVRAMRDLGFDFYWDDLYTPNIISKGFEKNDLNHFEAITVFECFEHFEDPLSEIEKLFEMTETIVFTTSLINVPAPREWEYYGFDHAQHISLFSHKSLEHVASKFNCKFYTKFGVHILTKKKIPFFKYKYWFAIFKSKIELKLTSINNINSLTKKDHYKLLKK